MIRRARAEELGLLREVERAAGRRFAELGMHRVADDEPLPVPALAAYQRQGRAWVWADGAGDGDDRPVAYLLASVVDGQAHVDQVSVHPDHARRGLGAALLQHLEGWARAHGCAALTLTTFTDVPWNGPYYQRLGFRYLSSAQESPGLRRVRTAEAAEGLDHWPRACMRREIGARGGQP
ncbi:GNAT family N-acetyltransferase [Rhodococcus sp. X156]|uniref:GNAT family N-acetyltransferase n=1 Tax=Rhodococcus sp. X156 TaxID=2499145 RepID=UPI001F49D23D|nr:GNAT family N-acetyltransferase [Rhodococcus sp. X156]